MLGCLSRSVRDAARYYDVAAGVDSRDPSTLPNPGRWEANLGNSELKGKRVAVLPSIAGVRLESGVEAQIRAKASELIAAAGMVEVDISLVLPNLAAQWAMGNLSTLLPELGRMWPSRADDLTDEIALGVRLSESLYNLHIAGGGRGAAHRGLRGDGSRVRPGRLHHLRHEPGPGVPPPRPPRAARPTPSWTPPRPHPPRRWRSVGSWPRCGS